MALALLERKHASHPKRKPFLRHLAREAKEAKLGKVSQVWLQDKAFQLLLTRLQSQLQALATAPPQLTGETGNLKELANTGAVAEKTKEQASQLGGAVFSGAGNIAAATGLVKKEDFPTDLKPEEVGQEAVEEPLIEPLLEPEGENYEEPPQEDYQEYEPEA